MLVRSRCLILKYMFRSYFGTLQKLSSPFRTYHEDYVLSVSLYRECPVDYRSKTSYIMSRTVVSLSIEEYNLAERVLPVVVDVTFQERRTPTQSNQSINQSIVWISIVFTVL